MTDIVELNQYGFYSIKNKPTTEELRQYYAEKYYQQAEGNYEQQYTNAEIKYFNNKIEQKYSIATKIIGDTGSKSLIDIGCGEGWTLNFFHQRGWSVTGLDYSQYGCTKFNPHCEKNLIVGDIYENLKAIVNKKEKFSIVWLDNVLEHVLDPLHLLSLLKKVVEPNGVIIVEVPNDFSLLQQFLLDQGHVDKAYWVAIPDHISYFSKDGLLNLAKAASLEAAFLMSDFPIDINLLNPLTNYYRDKTKGKSCYRAKIDFENLLHAVSIEKTNKLYEALLDLGLGRQIVAFLMPSNDVEIDKM